MPQRDALFCEVIKDADLFASREITTNMLVLGYHRLIGYQKDCGFQVEVQLTSGQREEIFSKVNGVNPVYTSPMFKHNLYAALVATGTLERNDAPPSAEAEPAIEYKFTVSSIVDIRVMKDEVQPPARIGS